MGDDLNKPLLVKLRADATPWADDPPTASIFYQALGIQLVAWARFEGHFVTALLQLTGLAETVLPTKEMPINWDRRGDFWKKAFRALPELSPIRDAALALMTDVIKAARSRGLLAHSRWGHFVSANPPAIELVSLRFESGGVFAAGNITLTLATLEHLTLAANTLNQRLVPISQFLSSLRPPPENIKLALRPIELLTIPHPQPPKSG